MDALSNVDPVDLDDNRAVWFDVNECIGRIRDRRVLARILGCKRTIQIQRDDEPARDGCGDGEKRAPTDASCIPTCGCCIHCSPSVALQLLRGRLDRLTDANVRPAAADVSAH